MSWLDDLLMATEECESPERYFWWSGIAAIAAIARRNVWIKRDKFITYPNIYVALVSAKSGARKGLPISVCKDLLEECEGLCRVITGCNSIQGLTYSLSQVKTFKNGLDPIPEAQGIMISGEFETFLTEDPKALTQLVELYNTHEHKKNWVKTLKGSPIPEELREPCLSMLVASNETLWNSMVKEKDTQGGFVARTFIVYEKKSRLYNSLVYPSKHDLNIKKLSERLKEISKIKGEFKWAPDAGEFYNTWYLKWMPQAEQGGDLTGTEVRVPEGIVKVAMLISLSRKDDLILELPDVILATKKVLECMKSVKTMMLDGGSANGNTTNPTWRILKIMLDEPNYTVSRARLLARLHGDNVNAMVLDRIIDTLQQSGTIRRPFKDTKKNIFYKLTDEFVSRYSGNLESIIEGLG